MISSYLSVSQLQWRCLLYFQCIGTPASDLQLAGNLPASVVMLAIDFQLAGNLPGSVLMLASDFQLAGNLPAAVAMLDIFSTY